MTGDDRAYLVYLALFLIFIGGSFLLSQRDRIGETLRIALIWGLIFLGVIAAYGMRDTITAQLYPNQGFEAGDNVTFRKSRDGHFYALIEVNGEPIDFVVDTGATAIVLTQRDAETVGINVDELSFSGRAYTANGVTGTARVRLDKVRIGSFEDRNVRASVNEGDMFSSLLGMEYLSRFGRITIEGDTLTLAR